MPAGERGVPHGAAGLFRTLHLGGVLFYDAGVGQRFTFSGGQITEYRPTLLDTPLR